MIEYTKGDSKMSKEDRTISFSIEDMVFEYDEVDGKPAYETTHMTTNKFAVGDWSCLYVCQWGGIDLTVDPYTWSGKGMIRLVVNAFFDFKVVRDGAIVYGEISQD